MLDAVLRAAGGAGAAVVVARGEAVQGGARSTATVSAAVLSLAGCTASLTSCWDLVGARGVETPVFGGVCRRHYWCALWAPLVVVVLALVVLGWC